MSEKTFKKFIRFICASLITVLATGAIVEYALQIWRNI